MTEQNTERKPRTAKADGPKSFVVKFDGKEYIIKLDAVRVASNADKDLALDGKLPRAKLEAAS